MIALVLWSLLFPVGTRVGIGRPAVVRSQRIILRGKDNNKAPRVHKRHSQRATATNNDMVWLSVIQEDDENGSTSSSSRSTT